MLEIDLNKLKSELERDEAKRLKAYKDSEGIWTIGVGYNLERHLPKDVATIMCDGMCITDEAADTLLAFSINEVMVECRRLSYWKELSPTRKRVVANMVFNLGYAKFLTFKRLNKALAAGDWNTAAEEMVNSKWYYQVGTRSPRLVHAMRHNDESRMRA